MHQPTKEERINIINLDAAYVCFGVEQGSQGTTPHLQGYVFFSNVKRFAGVKKLFPDRTHIEAARGTPAQNRKYCSKEGGEFIEVGECPQSGKRNDLLEFISHVEEGNTNRKKLRKEYPSVMARYPKFADEVVNDNLPVDKPTYMLSDYPWQPITDWSKTWLIHGPGRIGKTEFAKAHFPGGYLEVNRLDKLRTFDPGRHEGIIFDDADAAIQKLERSEKLALLEMKGRKSIPGRNVDADIPPFTKKIIVTNISVSLLFDMTDVSISDRLFVMRVSKFEFPKKKMLTEE